tara:strand:+ start:702 stop:866 length:165 start_codon:yes stop_codon:yes gene_type:complete
LYRTKLGAGTDKDMAFIEAVVQTGDLVFAEAKRERQGMIEQYQDKGKEVKHECI